MAKKSTLKTPGLNIFFRLKSVSENILCCEAQQLGDYLSNEHTKE